MKYIVSRKDRFGLLRPEVDAHTLGVNALAQALVDCGYPAVIADAAVCGACSRPEDPRQFSIVEDWLRRERITVLGFSYRLDPQEGADLYARFVRALKARGLRADRGGAVRALYFAGLPEACRLAKASIPETACVFQGDETPAETLHMLGIHAAAMPAELASGMAYDEDRLAFGRDLVRRGQYLSIRPPERGGYGGYGDKSDTLIKRMADARRRGLLPVIRAHAGPYLPDRKEAVALFLDWANSLAVSGYLDVLSIGSSQLTQSDFGLDWTGKRNGGGVPLNSPGEFADVWRAARPMLVRTYAGTRNIPALAGMYEDTIHIAWHALSLWWFCKIDGRGPHTVSENLTAHVETLKWIALSGKPFEPNISHHFAFRGADDVTCVVSAVLGARLAKRLGIRTLVLQIMLNTPKYLWGTRDLTKARATLALARELEDARFTVLLQPRGGLDYFSHDPEKAKAQLAAVTALMDDIEPENAESPGIIHVVSYSEGYSLADPRVIDESIRITRHALNEYRRLKRKGDMDDISRDHEVRERTKELVEDARAVLACVETIIPDLYTPGGLYKVLSLGFLPIPLLWECREEFTHAIRWRTKLIRGSMKVVDGEGTPIPVPERLRQTCLSAQASPRAPGHGQREWF